MSKELSRGDFIEESFWVADCPICGKIIESYDDPASEADVYCDSCHNTIVIVD